jgi:hypothetical protein
MHTVCSARVSMRWSATLSQPGSPRPPAWSRFPSAVITCRRHASASRPPAAIRRARALLRHDPPPGLTHSRTASPRTLRPITLPRPPRTAVARRQYCPAGPGQPPCRGDPAEVSTRSRPTRGTTLTPASVDALSKACRTRVSDSGAEIGALARPVAGLLKAGCAGAFRRAGPRAPPGTLVRARCVALDSAIGYARTGNIDDLADQSTYCTGVRQAAIKHHWYRLGAGRHTGDGRRASCHTRMPGVSDWPSGTRGRRRLTGRLGSPSRQRQG